MYVCFVVNCACQIMRCVFTLLYLLRGCLCVLYVLLLIRCLFTRCVVCVVFVSMKSLICVCAAVFVLHSQSTLSILFLFWCVFNVFVCC